MSNLSISPIWWHLPTCHNQCMKATPWLSFDTGHPAATKPLQQRWRQKKQMCVVKPGRWLGEGGAVKIEFWEETCSLADSGESGFRGFRAAASSSPGCETQVSFHKCRWIHSRLTPAIQLWSYYREVWSLPCDARWNLPKSVPLAKSKVWNAFTTERSQLAVASERPQTWWVISDCEIFTREYKSVIAQSDGYK